VGGSSFSAWVHVTRGEETIWLEVFGERAGDGTWRAAVREGGRPFSVVRALAGDAGTPTPAEAILAVLDGPTAAPGLEADGD
jgi:hypothetical protein